MLDSSFPRIPQMYWRKLHEIARRVTDTEVRLALPQQRTPQGHTFSIEGVIDPKVKGGWWEPRDKLTGLWEQR